MKKPLFFRSPYWIATFTLLYVLSCAELFAQGTAPWGGPSFSAEPKAILQAAKDVPNPKNDEVTVLLDDQRIEIDGQNRVTETIHLIYRVNTAEGVEDWDSAGTVWEPWHQERPQIKVRVVAADGTIYNLDPKNLVDAPARGESSSTYTDERRYHGPISGVGIGAVVEVEIMTRDTAPFFADGIVRREYLTRSVPVQQSRIVVEAPASLPLRYAVHLLPAAIIKKEDVEGKQRITVELGATEGVKNEFTNLPTDQPTWPHVDLATGKSWKSVNDSYRAMVEAGIHLDDLKSFLPKIDKSASRAEVLRTTVSRLHNQIRYTGVEFGQSGLVPQSTGEILKRKFGDCKDKATLLVSMLRAQGIPAHLALLVAGSEQDVEADMPGMGMFDHAIVVVPGTPDVWIDATAEYTPVGTLPGVDQGRAALVIREGDDALVRTPEVASSSNVSVEHREFFLADFGPARIVETTDPSGDLEAELRGLYGEKLTEDNRKSLDQYVRTTYLADKMTAAKADRGSDLEHPYELRLEAAKAKRGNTDQQTSMVYVPLGQLVNRLPKALRTEQDEDSNEKKVQTGREISKPRTEDFVLPEAFTHEWRYHVIPPDGFRVHGLPPNAVLALGPAKLTEEFKLLPDESVNAVFRFDTVKKRFTAEEARQLRKAILKLGDVTSPSIAFDESASILLRDNKIKEALATYRGLVARHPKEGLRRAKLARALLDSGLGEQARTEALAAIKVDPTSAYAESTLAWILEHDLVGRRFEHGCDREGAIAAYRKAKELDPKDVYVRANLGILLEHDKNGERYSEGANLKEAAAEYRGILALDKDDHSYDENLAYALVYGGQFKEAREFVTEVGVNDATRRGIFVAALAGESGAKTAIERSVEVSSSDSDRIASLFLAGRILMNMRRYPESAELMEAGSSGQSNSPQIASLVEILKHTKRFEELAAVENPAAKAIQAMVTGSFAMESPEKILTRMSKSSIQDGKTKKEHTDELEKQERKLQVTFKKGGTPFKVVADIGLSNLKFTVDNGPSDIYRVTMIAVAAKPQRFLVIKEDGDLKIVGILGTEMGDTGREVLSRTGAGDLAAAKAILDWTRDVVSKGGGDDPLTGYLFPRFWTKGQAGDKETMEYAAAAMVVDSKSRSEQALQILKRGEAAASGDGQRTLFELAIAREAAKEKKWDDAKANGEKVLKAEPLSESAFWMLASSLMEVKDWARLDSIIKDRAERLPDDMGTVRMMERGAEMRGDFAKAREIIKTAIDTGRASANDMNQFAWDSLFAGEVKAEDVEVAQRSLGIDKNSFATMHTLACLYAQTGKIKEAKDLLIQAMDTAGMDVPESSIWLVTGLLAEQYGELDAARAAYARMEKAENETPNSNYSLMQNRLKGLPTPSKTPSQGN